MLERKHYVQRPDYTPAAPQEAFIVPLRAAGSRSGAGSLPSGCSGWARPRCRLRTAAIPCPWLEAQGFHYVGLDVEQNPEGTVDVLCEIDQPLPEVLLAGEPFDFILCLEVLEHVADWEATFANFARLLRPGARALITCLHFYMLHLEPHDFWRPTPYAFQYFAARHGFTVRLQKTAGDGWDILGTLLASGYPQPVGRSLVNRLVNRAYWWVHRALLWGLRSRQLQSRVRWQSRFTFYQSNVVVLEKS
jgi:SAM-dependent methyltransferase